MNDLSTLRLEIDQIHGEFFDLVFKRFQITKQIWQYKKANQLPFLDESRELQLIHQFDDRFDNDVDRRAFQSVMKVIIESSKLSAENKL